ncbi:MAG: hypothetical protein FJ304_27340, partial [Planctomycetes bacterium]|nr:hypothetical protein [Planctomycetota bacterium]
MNGPITITATQAPGKRNRHIVVSARGETQLHRHVFDLNNATARNTFLDATLAAAFPETKPGRGPAAERVELSRQLMALASVPPGPVEPPVPTCAPGPDDPRVEALAGMSSTVRADALAVLSGPDL